MRDSMPAPRPTRTTFLTASLALIFTQACAASGWSAESNTIPGIGSWNVMEYHDDLLLQMKVPLSNGAFTANQFKIAAKQIGMSTGSNPTHDLHFTVERDAGTFVCTGQVSGRTANGVIVSFEPNQEFLRNVALQPITQHDALEFALFDVDRTTVAEALKANPHATSEDIVGKVMFDRLAPGIEPHH